MNYLLQPGNEYEKPLYPISADLPPDLSLQNGFPNMCQSPEQITAPPMNHYANRSASPTPYFPTYHYSDKFNDNSNHSAHKFIRCDTKTDQSEISSTAKTDIYSLPPILGFPNTPNYCNNYFTNYYPSNYPINYPTNYQAADYNTGIAPINLCSQPFINPPIIKSANIHQTASINVPLPPNINININSIPSTSNTCTHASQSTTNSPDSENTDANNIPNQALYNPFQQDLPPIIFNLDKPNPRNQTLTPKKQRKKQKNILSEIVSTNSRKATKKKTHRRQKKKTVAKQIKKKNKRKNLSIHIQNAKIPPLTLPINIDKRTKYVNTTCSPQRKRSTKNLKCSYCSKCFATNYELKRHLRIHTGERPYQCELCDKAFKQKQHRVTHQASVHDNCRPFLCNICQKKFKEKGTLTKHIQYTHQVTQTTFDCKCCRKTFKRKGNLKCHMKRIHKCEIF